MRDRELERWLAGEADRGTRLGASERVRRDDDARRVYDDFFAVLRALESGQGLESDEGIELGDAALNAAPSAIECDWLAEQFFESFAASEAAESGKASGWASGWGRGWGSSWLRWAGFAAVVVAVAGAFWWRGTNLGGGAGTGDGRDMNLQPSDRMAVVTPSADANRLVARGRGRTAELELELFCGDPPQPVNGARCAIDQSLTFAARETQAHAGERSLTLFGVDARGEAMYYAPTPVAAEGVPLQGQRWTPAEFSVQLDVNHRVGQVAVFALLAPRVATVDEVDTLAAALSRSMADTRFDAVGSDPWTTRLREELPASAEARRVLAELCPDLDACEAVQTQLQVPPSK